MDTKGLERNIKAVIKTGAGYGPEFKPVLRETKNILKRINRGRPTAENYFQLGTLCLKLEDHPIAMEAFKTGYQLNKTHLHCGTYYALLLEQQELWQQALTIYKELNELDPDNIQIVERMLLIFYNQKELKQVLIICYYFLEKKLYYPTIYDYISKVYYDCGNIEKAIEYIKNALSQDENNLDYLNRFIIYSYKVKDFTTVLQFENHIQQHGTIQLKLLYANSLVETGKTAESRNCFVKILKDNEDKYSILTEIALFHLHYEMDIDRSKFINKYILKRDPENVLALTNLALVSDNETAIEAYKAVIKQLPNDPLSRMNYGHRLLGAGHLKDGFKYYEGRVDLTMSFLSGRLFYPDSIKDKKIFIWNEQGIGDQISWSWFFQFLEKDNVQTKVQTDKRLLPLMRRSFPALSFTGESVIDVAYNENFKEYQAEIVNASLGKYYIPELLTALDQFENKHSYKPHLFADPDKIRSWKNKLSSVTNKKTIGICWRSGMLGKTRDYGYLQVEDIVDIFRDIDCSVVNLQYDYTENEVQYLQTGLGDRFINFSDIDVKNDQDELAALMSSLDLVFSVTTAVLSLSGALGVKTLSPSGITSFGRPFNILAPSARCISTSADIRDDIGLFTTELTDVISTQKNM